MTFLNGNTRSETKGRRIRQMEISETLAAQKAFFQSGKTLDAQFRINALKGLEREIRAAEGEILEALRKDLSKSRFEGYMTELGMVYAELRFMIANVRKLMRARRAKTPLSQFPSKGFCLPSPYGAALIVSPWNYPFQLTMVPLIDCIAAGNCALVKPSATSAETAKAIARILQKAFPPEYVAPVTGGREENARLFEYKFDVIFFTGGKETGRHAAKCAAENLTPVILELGGKSPCIVTEDANLRLAARRIAFGKLLNAGQTCVAPDYLLVHPKVKAPLLLALEEEIVKMYGEDPLSREDYPKMIGRRQFDRVLSLIDPEKTVFGGGYDEKTLKIMPTLLENVSFDDAAMREEIFGPVLPVMEAETLDDIKSAISRNPTPLALYWFGKDKKEAMRAVHEISFGGGCINDTVVHLTAHDLGFGGVGESGTGAYHGARGFFAFSHIKGILSKSEKIDLPFRYAPATPAKEKAVRKYMK